MAYDTEEEQIEAIRRWWAENGRSVIAGVIIAVAGVVGWQQWQSWQERSALQASARYDNLTQAVAEGQTQAIRESLNGLQQESAGSPYSVLGSLDAARHAAENGELDRAREILGWAREHAPTDALRQLTRLRLAQVEVAADEPQAALATLDPVPDGAYAARFHELRGDALVAADRREAAVDAYRAALDAEPTGQRRQYLQVKLNDLGVAVTGAS